MAAVPPAARGEGPHGRTPVTFTNRHGLRLFGILHTPAVPRTHDLAVVLLSPGVKMRVGPQGLYTRMAEEIAALGIPVLRFDFYGLGDSEGTLTEDLLRDVYNHIEVGRFVDDTLDCMNWMQQQYGTQRFILSGLCGGAITGLLAGGRDARVAGLLALGITPVLASRTADPAMYMTVGELVNIRRTYIEKLLNPKAWLRLLTFQSDMTLIRRTLFGPLEARLNAFFAKAKATATVPEDTTAAPSEYDNANPLFPPAFFAMLTGQRPMLLVFGGSDRLQWEYEEKFAARYTERLKALPPVSDVHVIKQANHVLSLDEWQREMLEVTTSWLRRRFPSDVALDDAARAPREAPATRPAVRLAGAPS